MLKKWFSLVLMWAFVISTMPVAAHASVSQGHAHKVEASLSTVEHHHCHHAHKGEILQKTAKADKHCVGHDCCEKNCKCIGGMCGSGSPSVIGAAGFNLDTPSLGMKYFGLAARMAAGGHDRRLKRPPRA